MRSFLFLISFFCLFGLQGQELEQRQRTLIVIFDGLRPDYITPELMPHLYSLKGQGAYGLRHHSVFPTVTRVNASSYATGSYPSTHGLLGNTVFFPEVDAVRGLNTGDAKELMRISRAANNKELLTTVSLGELMQQAGERMMVFSSGSSGQAFLQNHTISGGAVVNPDLILPSKLNEELPAKVGVAPPSATPNTAQHDWATRAWLEYGMRPDGPLVSAIWYSDPDATAHDQGMGHPLVLEAIHGVDEQLGIVIKALERNKQLGSFNIVVTADHGFVTQKGKMNIGEFLIQRGLKKSESSDDVVIAGNAVYVKDGDLDAIKKIVSALQGESWVGAVFTSSKKSGSYEGWVEGTLSFESIQWDHPRAGDILVDYNWDNGTNSFGYEGSSFAKGVAGHGGSSPYEIHIPLIVAGPAFRKGYESILPTSNVDIVPTVLHLHDLTIPTTMDGRVLKELLRNAPETNEEFQTETHKVEARHPWGIYRLILQRSRTGNRFYVDFTRVERIRH